jgi:hypothetical protein
LGGTLNCETRTGVSLALAGEAVTGPRGAFLLTSIQVLTGTFVLMWGARIRFKFINRGYYRSTVWVLWPLMGLLALVLPGVLKPWGMISAGAWVLFLAAVYSQRPALEWITGALGSGAGVWLVVGAGRQTCAGGCTLGLLHALAGALTLGSVTHGMVLGHWYLNQARLPIEPLKEQTLFIFGALGISGIAGIATRRELIKGAVPAGILTYATVSYWWVWVLLLVSTIVLAGMVWATVKSRSTQSATGLLYIAMVIALAGQFLLNLLATT